MKKALLIQPAYPYGKPQTWLPTSLHKVAAGFEAGGTQTDVVDLNLEPFPSLQNYDNVGIGVIGMPYIPETRRIAKRVFEETGKTPLIGGPIIEFFTPDEFQEIYPNSAQVRGEIVHKNSKLGRTIKKTDPVLQFKGIEAVPVYEVSIAQRIKQMPDDSLKKYLENEFDFFVSQGCKYGCHFCAAAKNRREEFSEHHVMQSDLEAICEAAGRLQVPKLNMYLSSLDLFQNPEQFKEVLGLFAHMRKKYRPIDIEVRGLSRCDSFLTAIEQFSEFYTLIPESGLRTIGFGVDGVEQATWNEQNKRNKSLSDFERTFTICRELGVTPESLMVTGFHNPHTYEGSLIELKRTVEYAIKWADKYGAVCRPHVAKDFSPGNTGWENPKWAEQRARLVRNPDRFMCLDYLMPATELSHPDPGFRGHVNDAFWKIINELTPRGLCATVPLLPCHAEGAYAAELIAAALAYHLSPRIRGDR